MASLSYLNFGKLSHNQRCDAKCAIIEPLFCFNGVDSISISKRLGHAQPSTTTNIYAHIIEEADKKNADIIADVFLKKA